MKKLLTTLLLLAISFHLYSQINAVDSTVQIIGYWQKKEKQSYEITHRKYKVKDNDTTARELMSYQVDVSIKDSTATGYSIEWFYKNFAIRTDNELVKKISSLAQDMPVVLTTDQFGAIVGVSNWTHVRDYMQKVAKFLEKDLKALPNGQQIMAQIKGMYMSKEAIEANAIKDAQQFYTFHGGKYTLGEEIKAQMQLANNYGGKPFDTDVKVSVDEINEQEDYAILRAHQRVNPQQLTDVTYEYLKKITPINNSFPSKDKFPLLTNDTWTVSQIHGSSGWIIYSKETKHVKAEGVTSVEERVIELK
jgi:hypothetical protein